MSLYPNCSIYISTPGVNEGFTTSNRNEYWHRVEELFKKYWHNETMSSVDTLSGWWSLNQDWIQILKIDMEVEWGYSVPVEFTPEDKEELKSLLQTGKIIMMVYDSKGHPIH